VLRVKPGLDMQHGVYTWEETDTGEPSPPPDNSDGNRRPLFRSVPPSRTGYRYFPDLMTLMNPCVSHCFEVLPTGAQEFMTFTVAARNQRGRYSLAEVKLTLDRNSGPFSVNATVNRSWRRGSSQTISWTVANTDQGSVNTQQVKLSLLILDDSGNVQFDDKGEPVKVVLADAIPNTGSASIAIPSGVPVTKRARIMVEAVGNVFFAIAPTDVQITE
jgi:hypothetical protein